MRYGAEWDERPEVIAACLDCPYDECQGDSRCPRRMAVIHRLCGMGGRGRGKLYELDGRTLPLGEWGRRAGISWHTLYNRMRRGMSLREALELPVTHGGAWRVRVDGVTHDIAGWARVIGMEPGMLLARIRERGGEASVAVRELLALKGNHV